MPILCMFPVHDVLHLVTSLFHIQPHAKRPWESDQKPLSENARKLHFFESNLSRSPRLLFSMPQPFQNQYDWLPTSHGWCPHLHEKFLDSTAPGPKIPKNTCQDNEVMCWNEESSNLSKQDHSPSWNIATSIAFTLQTLYILWTNYDINMSIYVNVTI